VARRPHAQRVASTEQTGRVLGPFPLSCPRRRMSEVESRVGSPSCWAVASSSPKPSGGAARPGVNTWPWARSGTKGRGPPMVLAQLERGSSAAEGRAGWGRGAAVFHSSAVVVAEDTNVGSPGPW